MDDDRTSPMGAGTGTALPPEDRALAVAPADQLGTVLAHGIQP